MLHRALSVGVGWAFLARVAVPFLVVMLSGGGATAAAQAAERADVLLILDASGSMFNELDDGRYRITAAKEALASFISRLPEDTDLGVGLRVYGSQLMALDEGACEDSLLRVPVGPVDRDLLLTTVQGTDAKGATPIAYSLERAAEDLAGATGRKVIVLVTDGEESCGGDVRAVAERLAGQGFEIDLRVIGFALTPEAAASFEGVGTFENATSAGELADALGRAVALPAEDLVRVTVRLTRDGAPARDGAAVRFVESLGGGQHVFAATADGEFVLELPAGSYAAVVSDAFSAAPLTVAGLVVAPDAVNAFAFELAPAVEVELMVSPTDPVMGSRVTVSFAGAPPGASAWLTVVPVTDPDDSLPSVEGVTGASGSAEVRVPMETAQLEVRYHLMLPEGGTLVVGRSAPFTARQVEVSLDAPDEVSAGAGFEVAWDGPGNDADLLTVAPAGAAPTEYLAYAFVVHGNPGALTAPVDPGQYEVRYVAGSGGGVLASRPLSVVAAAVAVTVPQEVGAGTNVAVTWQGPDGQSDMVVFAPQGAPAGEYLSYAFTVWGSSLELVAPVDPGAYEVRYVSGAEQRVLAASPVTVTPVEVTLVAPDEVAPGEVFTVVWTGPNGANDYVTIVPVGSPEGTAMSTGFTAWGETLDLTAPDQPGEYEIRYFAGTGRVTLASVPIRVR